MKKLLIIAGILFISIPILSQEKQDRKAKKQAKKEEERKRIDQLTRAEEEGILVYSKQKVFGIQLRTNGYGFYYEKAKKTSPRNARVYGIEFNEIKDIKEDKLPNGSGGWSFGNPYVYGKINNFYQLQLGFGIQRILGQKGNKNGVAVGWLAKGGLSLGMLRPYYIEVADNNGNSKLIKYTPQDSADFVGGIIIGSGGIGMGWGEMKFKPGIFVKSGLRFDFGKFNEVVSALEVGLSAEFFSSDMPIMLFQDEKKFFYQGHVAFMFGHRK